jgi:hypothetical protein
VRAENTTRDRDLPGRTERVVDAMLDVDVEAHATVENITLVVTRRVGRSRRRWHRPQLPGGVISLALRPPDHAVPAHASPWPPFV